MFFVDTKSFVICKFVFENFINLQKQKENKQTFEKEIASEYDCKR